MRFDDFYSISSSYFSMVHSDGMEECLRKYSVLPCKAVDIGAGEGRNSIYLASIGFNVTAIEPSEVGATKIMDLAENNHLVVNVLNTDFLSASKSLSNVGLVVALTSLEHMEYDYMMKAISEIKRMMAPGGYFYAIVFTEKDPGFKRDIYNASECALFVKHYFKAGELKSCFSDYDVLEYSEYIKEDKTHGSTHYHGKAKIFARKPL